MKCKCYFITAPYLSDMVFIRAISRKAFRYDSASTFVKSRRGATQCDPECSGSAASVPIYRDIEG
jgi:hypothetical protein